MNLPTVIDLIADRETTDRQDADRLREQITALTTELAHLDDEVADLAKTRSTPRILAAAPTGMRAKGICLALGVEPSPKHVEGYPREAAAARSGWTGPRCRYGPVSPTARLAGQVRAAP